MKQLLFAVAAASFLCFAACKPNHNEMKKQFMKNCEASITDQADEVSKEAMHEYCECSADKVFAEFSEDELIAFNKMSEAEREKKLEPVVKPCLDALRQKTMEPQPAATDSLPSTTQMGTDSTEPAAAY